MADTSRMISRIWHWHRWRYHIALSRSAGHGLMCPEARGTAYPAAPYVARGLLLLNPIWRAPLKLCARHAPF